MTAPPPWEALPRPTNCSCSNRRRDHAGWTDRHAGGAARQAGLSHEAVNLSAGERVRGALHGQNVNAYHRRFRQWLARFSGVASRYLPNYLGWQWAVDGRRIDTAERMLRAALAAPASRFFNSER